MYFLLSVGLRGISLHFLSKQEVSETSRQMYPFCTLTSHLQILDCTARDGTARVSAQRKVSTHVKYSSFTIKHMICGHTGPLFSSVVTQTKTSRLGKNKNFYFISFRAFLLIDNCTPLFLKWVPQDQSFQWCHRFTCLNLTETLLYHFAIQKNPKKLNCLKLVLNMYFAHFRLQVQFIPSPLSSTYLTFISSSTYLFRIRTCKTYSLGQRWAYQLCYTGRSKPHVNCESQLMQLKCFYPQLPAAKSPSNHHFLFHFYESDF